MAGPSVMVRILGDASNLAKSAQDSANKTKSAFSGVHASLSGMLGMLNQTGVLGPFGDALNMADQAISHIAEHGKDVGNVMMGAGGALLAVGGLFSQLGSKEAAAHQQLSQAITNTGKSYSDYAGQIDSAIKHQEKFGNSSVETQQALQALTQATGDPTKAIQLLGEASDLAAAKHESLSSAATQLGKVYNGSTKMLKEFGITVTATTALTKQAATAQTAAITADKNLATAKQKLADLEAIDHTKAKLTLQDQFALRDAQQKVVDATEKSKEAHDKLTAAQLAVTKATAGHGQAVDLLAAKLHGQAAASADTFAGHLKAITTTVEDQAAKFGEKWGPAMQKAGGVIAGLGGIMKIGEAVFNTFGTAQKTAAAATDVMSASEDAAAVSEGLALWPILLIVAAIGLLIAAAYEIYKHWNEIWSAIKKIIQDVWDWIKNNWPLLLGILLGPFGLFVAEMVKHWTQVKQDALAVVNYIIKIWNDLVGFFVGIPGRLAAVAGAAFNFLISAAQWVAAVVEGVWNNEVAFFTGLPGRIASAASGMWNAVYNQAVGIYNGVVGLWNGLMNWFAGLPARIAWIAGSMWSGVTNAFRAAINSLIDIWNRLHFTIGGWHIGPVGIPTVSVGMPPIPHLAQGGLITASGLAVVHAGERVLPAQARPARGGPVVHIDHAHFAQKMDVDAFMDRVAWAARKTAV